MAVGAATFVGLDPAQDDSEDTDRGNSTTSEDNSGDNGLDTAEPDLVQQAFDGFEGGETASASPVAFGLSLVEPEDDSDGRDHESFDGDDKTGDIISGDDDLNTIGGTVGNDQINGYDGDDTVTGGGGDDQMYGGLGRDDIHGEDGEDTLHGGDDEDELFGDDEDDDLFGHNGQDSLEGGSGDDSLVGSAGNDHLRGDDGDDALHGDLDDDTLDGGMGQDTLFGGWGDDVVNGVTDDDTTEEADDIDGRDYLNGGGDDLIIAGRDDIVTAGAGEDSIVLGDWLSQDHQAEVLDFSAAEDSLMVFFDDSDGTDPEVSLEADEENGSNQHIVLNGVRIAMIANAGGLSLDHITLLPQSSFGTTNGL
ncbi:calcium-binding protein [Roseovarius gaetbuli]|nr:calcium-binding protein [Roseovarius gaetbuli]